MIEPFDRTKHIGYTHSSTTIVALEHISRQLHELAVLLEGNINAPARLVDAIARSMEKP